MKKWLIASLLTLSTLGLAVALGIYTYLENLTKPGPYYVHPEILAYSKKYIFGCTVQIPINRILFRDSRYLYVLRSEAYSYIGNHEHALHDVETLIKLNPNDFSNYLDKVYLLIKMNQYDEALRFAKQTLKFFPGEPYLYWALGDVYFVKGEFENAAKNYTIFMESDNYRHDELDAVKYFIALERSKLAGQIALQEIRIDTPSPRTWNLSVYEAFSGSQDWNSLLRQVDNAKTWDQYSQIGAIYFYYGQQKILNGQPKEAQECFKKCMATGITNADEYWLAKAELERMGALPAQN